MILALVAFLSISLNIPVLELTRDPSATKEVSSIIGILSNLGILLWCATVSICLFSAIFLIRLKQWKGAWLLGGSAVLTIFLLIDDLFMFHDYLSESGGWFGEKKYYLVLTSVTALFFWSQRKTIFNTNYLRLLLALAFFASSLLIDTLLADQLEAVIGQWMYFVEDGLKWLGISCWLSYYGTVSFNFITENLKSPFN